MKNSMRRTPTAPSCFALVCAVFLSALGAGAEATTYNVTTTADSAFTAVDPTTGEITTGSNVGAVTLRSAVIAANSNGAGPHTINVPAGTYDLSQTNPNSPATTATIGGSDLVVGGSLATITITGTGGQAKIVQTVAGADVISTGFNPDSSPAIVTLTLNNLEITGGQFAAIATGQDNGTNHSSTTITNCNIHDNSNSDGSNGQGGAIRNRSGDLTIANCVFSNNSATNGTNGQGGAIFYNVPGGAGGGAHGALSISSSTFNSNTAAAAAGPAGGAIYVAVAPTGGAASITGCTFTGNQATGGGDGGALAIANNTSRLMTITASTFLNNTVTGAAGDGGAVHVQSGPTNLTYNRFVDNSVLTAANGSVLSHTGGNTDAVNANDNWWGRAGGPALNEIVGVAITASAWLELQLSPTASPLHANTGTTITASVLTDSAGNSIAVGNLGVLIGQPITFGGGASGSISNAQTTIQSNGTATATFTAGNAVTTAEPTAQVDNPPPATTSIGILPNVTTSVGALPANATTVVINGFGFDPNIANDTVSFNDQAFGSVTTATANSLTVTFSNLPANAGSLTAVVVVDGVSSGSLVQIATVTPVVTASSANLALNANSMTINGFGFDPTPANNSVTFSDGAVGSVIGATRTSLTVVFSSEPTTLGSLTAVVSSDGVSSGAAVPVGTVVGAANPVVSASTATLPAGAPTLLITGSGFDPIAANNSVFFNNGAVGTVTNASATSLTVTFSTKPITAGALTASVETDGVFSGAQREVAQVIPQVTQDATLAPVAATTLVINGYGFDPTISKNSVTLNDGAFAAITKASPNSLTLKFSVNPATAGSLTAVVVTDGISSGAPVQVAAEMPVVTPSVANLPSSASSIVINGAGFDPVAAHNSITFNDGAAGSVTSASTTSLTVTFSTKPVAPGSLTALVTTNGISNGSAVQVATALGSGAPTVTAGSATIPASASSITISGSGFDTMAANNSVIFNDSAVGSVTNATATSLTVAFSTPPATAGPLTAIVATNGVSSGAAVTLGTVIPVITSSTASLLANADTIVVNGFGFDPTRANNTVRFSSGAIGSVTKASPTSLTVKLSTKPTSAGSLTALVITNDISSGPLVQVATVVPVVTSSAMNLSSAAPTITIHGFGFSTQGQNAVVFNDSAAGTVTQASNTSLTVSFTAKPTASGPLTAVVTSNGAASGAAVQVATVVAVGAPAITSSTASLGINSPTVVIHGVGFDPVATNDSVTFNDGAVGIVTTAAANQLTVTFSTPPANVGPLTAVVTSDNVTSGAALQVATVVPVVTTSTANLLANANSVVINGFGFDAGPSQNAITFNDSVHGKIIAATTTSLTYQFSTKPSTAGSLTASVTRAGVSSGVPVQIATVVPVVTASTSDLLPSASSLTIHGFGFDLVAAHNTVVFNASAVGSVTAATKTTLTVKLTAKPAAAGPLTAVVTTNAVSSGAPIQVATALSSAAPIVTPVFSTAPNLPANSPTITINGVGFEPVAANNTVVFNDGAVGTVTAASGNSLLVTFSTPPAMAGNLTAIVTTDGVSSGAAVKVATVEPVVTSSSTALSATSNTLVINGFGFEPATSKNTVVFNDGAVGKVVAATTTSLTVSLSAKPASAGSLTAEVVTNGVASAGLVQVAVVTPVVTTSSTGLLPNAGGIVINGFGFDPTAAHNTVSFDDGAAGTVTMASPTSLTVTFTSDPSAAGDLDAVVTTNGQSSGAAVQVAIVLSAPMISGDPADETVVAGAKATFTAAATGNPNPKVQWQVSVNGGGYTNVSGATSKTLSFKATAADNGNLYRAMFTNRVGFATTNSAKLTVIEHATAVNDIAYILDNTPQDIDVLANDLNPSNSTLTIVAVTQGRHSSVTIVDNGMKVNYAPKGKIQPDTFTYTISDGLGGTSKATVDVFPFFRSEAGAYNGLVQAASGVTQTNDNAGLVRVVINATSGKFTGSLRLATFRYQFSGVFDVSGVAHFGTTRVTSLDLKRKNLPDLSFSLQIGLSAPINEITGALTEGGNPFGVIAAERALYTASKTPVLPFMKVPPSLLGKYTVVFAARQAPNNGLPATSYPQGHGIGLLTIGAGGNAHVTGTLADGSVFTYGNALSMTNEWPFYVAFASGKASISGSAVFAHNTTLQSDLDGIGLNWFKPAKATAKIYPSGWENGIQTDLLGSKLTVPPNTAHQSILPGLGAPGASGNANVFFVNADVPAPGIIQPVNISGTNAVTIVPPNTYKVHFQSLAKSGLFKGTFVDPATNAVTNFQGVVFQDQSIGYGFFLGGGQSGAVTLAPQ